MQVAHRERNCKDAGSSSHHGGRFTMDGWIDAKQIAVVTVAVALLLLAVALSGPSSRSHVVSV